MEINLLFSIDDHYIEPFKTTLYSVYQNTPSALLHVFVLQKQLLKKHAEIESFCEALGIVYDPVVIGERAFEDAPIADRYPETIYYRLLAYEYLPKDLDKILQEQVFEQWEMKETQFGPVSRAVPTVRGQQAGVIHDPKARLLGKHAGSAGLFSTVHDLKIFLEHYLQDNFAADLSQNFSDLSDKERSLAWNLEGDWLDHTGYTGNFIMWNRKKQEAAIFLSNRTYEKDERAQWILDRNQVMDLIREAD